MRLFFPAGLLLRPGRARRRIAAGRDARPEVGRHTGSASTAAWVREVDAATPRLAVNARTALNPASTMKLVTTYAALDLLGPAYVWKTEAFASGTLSEGVLHGRPAPARRRRSEADLRPVRPPAAPDTRARHPRDTRRPGARSFGAFLTANGDPARFDAQPMRPYNVAPDALLVNFKAVTLQLVPDRQQKTLLVSAEPAPANLDLINKITLGNGNGCGDWKERLRADVFAHGPTTRLVLTGVFPPGCSEQRWNIAVMDHPQFVLGVFQQLWAELGGSMSGGVRDGPVPADARPLAVLPSPTLAEVVRDINKFSNNVMARQLFLTWAWKPGAVPPATEDADAAIRAWLDARGLALPELVLENGSGLSRRERDFRRRPRPRAAGAAWKSAVMPELVASLPVTATDGTMRKRLKQNGVAGQAHIKTGSLEGVRSIAGWVLDRSGRRWIVVFFVNHAHAGGAQAAQDALLEWVYAGRGT
jgi:D-alanyl-D-alanine carboxypeptidase/D-alanyl-D-alanine-endopeptidase (penicillin-binding protein 4)